MIYLVEIKVESLNENKNSYTCSAYESEKEAYRVVQEFIQKREGKINWGWSFGQCRRGEVKYVGEGVFPIFEDDKKSAPGRITIDIREIRFVRDESALPSREEHAP